MPPIKQPPAAAGHALTRSWRSSSRHRADRLGSQTPRRRQRARIRAPAQLHPCVCSAGLNVLDDNGLNLVGDIIEEIDTLLQMIVDFLAAHKFHGIAKFGSLVKDFQSSIVDVIGAALETAYLQADFIELSNVAANIR